MNPKSSPKDVPEKKPEAFGQGIQKMSELRPHLSPAEAASDRQETALESIPESERWDPVPGSPGHQAPESPAEDEDEEGRSESEQLAETGVENAERDQVRKAAQTDKKNAKDQP